LYPLRISFGTKPTGFNHNLDHMASRQGVWVALLSELGLVEESRCAANVLRSCVKNMELSRGYHIVSGIPQNHSTQPVSGDMLIGFCLGYLYEPQAMAPEMIAIGWNLLEHKGLTTNGVVSKVANFKPGINTSSAPVPVGAQDITYLCGLRCAMDASSRYGGGKENSLLYKNLRKKYWLRFWLYGGFITCLFPTAGTWFKRGYNNDNVVLQSGFILRRLVSNWFERLVFTCSIIFTWSLSWPWLNSFFTGICKSATAGYIPGRRYCLRAARYAVDFRTVFASMHQENKAKAPYWPVDPDRINPGEFLCDEDQETMRWGRVRYHSTLGQLANLAFIKRSL
jgi:hypothetical protein